MTAVMRFADARLKASSISRSSIRWSLVGAHIDWITKTSPPRTFSVISTWTSPSLNRPISAAPSGTPIASPMALASERFELPANILISSFTVPALRFPRTGREGVEPSLPDPKSGALPAWRPPKVRRHDPTPRNPGPYEELPGMSTESPFKKRGCPPPGRVAQGRRASLRGRRARSRGARRRSHPGPLPRAPGGRHQGGGRPGHGRGPRGGGDHRGGPHHGLSRARDRRRGVRIATEPGRPHLVRRSPGWNHELRARLPALRGFDGPHGRRRPGVRPRVR